MSDSANQNSNAMDVDSGNPSQEETMNDYMIALLAQQQELEMSGNATMNPNDIDSFKKRFREYQASKNGSEGTENNNGTENDEEIAKLMQENYIREQEMLNMLGRNDKSYPAFIPKSNSNKINENLKDYHTSELQKQYHERYIKEKLSHEYFRNKLNSKEATQIKKQIRDFYIDFEQKTKNVFVNPEEQSQYLRNFLMNLSRALIENPLWANSDKEEQENAIIEMEKIVTKKLFDITFGPSEDLAKDALLSHKIQMHSWVEPRHLDLPDFDYHIFDKAGNELQKMNIYKFYIDKIICICNCIKLIEFAYRKNINGKEPLSNDKLLSLLIFVILKTNPKKLISNVQYIARYVNPNLLSVGIYEYSLTSIWGSITFIEKISQTSLTITSEEYDANIIEMTKVANDKMEEGNMDGIFRNDSRDGNSGGLIQSVMGFLFGGDSANPNNEADYPYQGIFSHLDSVNSANSVNRNGSSLSSNSILVNDYRKELREKYLSNANEPLTRPFESHLTEEEQNALFEVDKELKASLSISSNKGEDKKN
ncbi:hypothetical protein BCR32DRAFT_1353 [Anaeromyces robustus]|jgi:hypothetical protein|uniref:VPS9 domain-containing protein n=1 Tax=Anaeromyces robustus TaxID=1754192 RepID=A0A1Y1XRB0_9FUNG|nr:hypothetical protein BCR32DRAFT_1353 [Anaeromyces robustus]|eukprot:ORX88288.1 hypothetical protein BCR32DRAFT_1353 [Anaeromyces robustus]